MSWLTQWQLSANRMLLRRARKKLRVERYSKPFSEIRTVGLLFDATELDPREEALKYSKALKQQGKRVTKLGFFNNTVENPSFTFRHFNRKHLDWALRPKKQEVKDFILTDFDLLLLAFRESTFLTEYVGGLSHARMRVGPVSEKTFAYDLMIDGGPAMELSDFFRQADQVLKLIDRKHEEAPL